MGGAARFRGVARGGSQAAEEASRGDGGTAPPADAAGRGDWGTAPAAEPLPGTRRGADMWYRCVEPGAPAPTCGSHRAEDMFENGQRLGDHVTHVLKKKWIPPTVWSS